MEIKIDDKEWQAYIEKTVEHKIDALVDDVIQAKVQKVLLDRVDGIFMIYNHDIKCFIDKHVKEHIETIYPTVDKKLLKEVGQSIAHSIAWELRDDVLESIAYRLMPKAEEDEEED